MWTDGSVVEFQLCFLWLPVQSPRGEIMVYTADETKQLSSVSVYCVQVFAGFSGHGNSIHNINPLLKKKMYIYILALEVIITTRICISNPPGKTWTWRWSCPLKEYRCNLQDTFRLTGSAITMASWFGVTCVRCGLMAQ